MHRALATACGLGLLLVLAAPVDAGDETRPER